MVWCRSYLVWLVFEDSIPTCTYFHSCDLFPFYTNAGLHVTIMKCCIYTGPPGNTTVFQSVPSGFYYLRVTATSGPEEGEVTWKVYMYVPTTSSICSVNLINTGLVVDGTSVSMEFRGMGPTSVFTCRLDDRQFHSCEFYCVD